jgi:hypothetical protein
MKFALVSDQSSSASYFLIWCLIKDCLLNLQNSPIEHDGILCVVLPILVINAV